MPARKRRKPDGVLSFVAEVIGDQQKARSQARSQQAKVQMAWARENAKVAAANAREETRQEQRETKERQVAAGQAEAAAATRTLQARLTELDTLLAGTLDEDPYLPFDHFKEPMRVIAFRPPEAYANPAPQPQVHDFMPEPVSGLGALTPGRKRAYAAAVAQGQADYEKAIAEHARDERSRLEQIARARDAYEQFAVRERERIRLQHTAVDQMARHFAEGGRKAVADYFREVLAMQRYPGDFPVGVKVAFMPDSQEVRVDIDLPLLSSVPELESAEYLVARKELRYKRLTVPARSKRYQKMVAQMALRTIRCIFTADRSGLVRQVVCNGYVDTINAATGQPAHWCLVSVMVSREEFDGLDLANVDPQECLAYLHAKLSRTPERYQPVQPIIEYPWDDLHYAVEADALVGLDGVKNLLELDGYEFEDLILRLCKEIPEFDEVRKTRTRQDGGIDLVAVNKTPFVGGRVAIQAKRYKPRHKVDIAAVREIIGSISQREFTKGIIVTTSTFTSAARQEAERLGVELYDGERLLWLLRHHLHREFTIIDPDLRKPPFKNAPGPNDPSK